MDIKLLNKEEYKNQEFLFEYTTNSYLDIVINDNKYEFVSKQFSCEQYKSFKDSLFQDYFEAPIAYGAFVDGKLIGFIEGSIETWSNRFRITNLLVFNGYRNQGVGQRLMNKMFEVANNLKARLVILETQTCNEKAIKFYLNYGFKIIGFDLFCYSNEDLEKNEVRLEMGKRL